MLDQLRHTHFWQIFGPTITTLVIIGGLFVIIYGLERRAGIDVARYRTKNFANDFVYALFYQSGIYHVVFVTLIGQALEPRLAIFKIGILANLPLLAAGVVYWLSVDFLNYFTHRMLHAVPLFWAFHSVHHSQERITFLSTFRNHPMEQLFLNTVMMIPVLILGVPPRFWLPLFLAQQFFEAVQHSELDWRYGRLHRVFVSPAFHRLHHSSDPRHHNRNFSKILSVWDFLFGTAVEMDPVPRTYGVEGLEMKETLWSQFLTPFRLARKALGRRAA